MTAAKKPKEREPASASAARLPATPTLSFSRVNALWLGAGALVVAVGFLLLAQGSTILAPILLVFGYCVLLPVGIIKK